MFILYIKLNIHFGYKTTKSFLPSQKHSSSTCHNNTVCACVSRVTAECSLNKTKLRGWGWPQSVCFTLSPTKKRCHPWHVTNVHSVHGTALEFLSHYEFWSGVIRPTSRTGPCNISGALSVDIIVFTYLHWRLHYSIYIRHNFIMFEMHI